MTFNELTLVVRKEVIRQRQKGTNNWELESVKYFAYFEERPSYNIIRRELDDKLPILISILEEIQGYTRQEAIDNLKITISDRDQFGYIDRNGEWHRLPTPIFEDING